MQCRSLCATFLQSPMLFWLPHLYPLWYSWPAPSPSHPPPTHCHLFSFSHVSEAVRVIHSSRTPNEEGFQVEFFKLGISVLGPFLTVLFNLVVCVNFPDSWSWHIIYLIHKSRLASNPKNYKTIMVGHTFAKLYATVLNRYLVQRARSTTLSS